MEATALIFIVGPTAAGKSEISLQAAQRLNAEIICCDALQVYQEITIASDKPSVQARAQVPHHVLDSISVTEDFNAARFRRLALAAIGDIQSRRKTPLIVGGSGMYMAVLLDGIFEGTQGAEDLREALSRDLSAEGLKDLYGRLKAVDPKAAARIHPHDPQRILRALQVTLSTGKPISELQEERDGLWGKMPVKIFALNRPRQELYRRAEERVERMFSEGLVDEVKRVSALPLSKTARKLIGIPEVTGYLNGAYDLDRAKYLMKLHTRHYVKRQLTWFRRDKRLIWIDITQDQTSAQVADIIVRQINDHI